MFRVCSVAIEFFGAHALQTMTFQSLSFHPVQKSWILFKTIIIHELGLQYYMHIQTITPLCTQRGPQKHANRIISHLHAKYYSRVRPWAIAEWGGYRASSAASLVLYCSWDSTCKQEMPLNYNCVSFIDIHSTPSSLTFAKSFDYDRPSPDIDGPWTCPDTWSATRRRPGRRSPSSHHSADFARNRIAGKSWGISAGRSSRPPDLLSAAPRRLCATAADCSKPATFPNAARTFPGSSTDSANPLMLAVLHHPPLLPEQVHGKRKRIFRWLIMHVK